MAILSTNPSAAELANLAKVFTDTASELQKYLSSAEGQADPNFVPLITLAIELNNTSDEIAVMQLTLAVAEANKAIGVINQTVEELQKAIKLRNDITRDLGIVQDFAALGAAIVAKDPGSIVSSGTDLYKQLTAILTPSNPP